MRAALAERPRLRDLQGGDPGCKHRGASPAALAASLRIRSSRPDVDRIDFRRVCERRTGFVLVCWSRLLFVCGVCSVAHPVSRGQQDSAAVVSPQLDPWAGPRFLHPYRACPLLILSHRPFASPLLLPLSSPLSSLLLLLLLLPLRKERFGFIQNPVKFSPKQLTFETTPSCSDAVCGLPRGRLPPGWVSPHLSRDPDGKTGSGWGWFTEEDTAEMQQVRVFFKKTLPFF